MSISALACSGLEQIVNGVVDLDPVARQEIRTLHGRVFAFELEGLGVRFYLVPGPDRVQILSEHEGEPDCTLRGTPLALAQLGDTRRSSRQLTSGGVRIGGDTELAHRLGKILGDLDIDWEEQLSRLSGDIAAHEVGNTVRSGARWGRSTLNTLGMNLREYLQEELGVLPVRAEIESLLADVDTLRDDVERLEARIRRLRGRRGSR